ncbi:MAG: PAS domain S-box protein [Proteobacteria bacterium]|nr:PAS domain S-box protein [Pseudomonadota bacterium]
MNDEEKTREELLKELQWLRYSLNTIKAKEEEYNKLEDERTKYEELVHILLNSNPEAVFLINNQGKITLGNEAAGNRLNMGRDELIGMELLSFFTPEAAKKIKKHIDEAFFTGKIVHFEDAYNSKYYDNYLYPVFNPEGQVSKVAMFSMDTTERKNAEKALKQLEKKYRITYENVIEGVFQTTPEGRFLNVNNALARILGYNSPEDLIDTVVEIASEFFADPNRRSEFLRLLRERSLIYNFEAQMHKKDRSMNWVSINARAIRDKKGNILYYEGTVEDITKRKRLEVQLIQSQKIEAVGRLAGGMAHDFSNLLTTIMGNLALLIYKIKPDDSGYKEIVSIQETSGRALKLCQQLLSLSRSQLLKLSDINLNDIVLKMEKMLKRLLGEDIQYDLFLDPDISLIKADPSLIEQLVLNLSVNARDAMPTGGTLSITTINRHFDADYCRTNKDMLPGEYVLLTIADTGTGILPSILAHIFEPFYTIRPDGIGLGLSVVYSIVKQFGGNISVDSEEDKGSIFTICFPALVPDKETADASLPPANSLILSGKATILVVEDESGILNMVTDVLEGLDYNVIAGISVDDAISKVEANEGPIDLLITDVVLPGKKGTVLVDMLKARYPQMKAILMSGYTDERIPHEEILKGKVHFISKPFTPFVLVMKVQEVLGDSQIIL